ncbi:male sterility protein [Xylogone sp. PMI_703]|nr:male sterility protein [Xylogone sp. PMI_703]
MTFDTSFPLCSDPLVVPSPKASKKILDLWTLHGHPHSKRYSNPKLVSLGALIRHDGIIYKGHKAMLYPKNSDINSPYESMTWDEFDAVTETLALMYARQLEEELKSGNATQKQPTIGLLGKGRTLEYFCTQLALQKLGVRVLLLAESNAIVALHHLLQKCDVSAVIVDSENADTDTNGVRKIALLEQLPRDQETEQHEVDSLKFQDFSDVWERHTYIIHSSGSTGMPKPIIHTNRSMMLIARMYRLYQEFEVVNWFLLFPLYHIAGISIALSGLPNGMVLSFPPLLGPMATKAIFQSWRTLESLGYPVDCIHCAPTLIENFFEHILDTGGDFGPLASMKVVQPGGAALSEKIIKVLVDNGVNVKSTYGSTEIGPPMRTIPHSRSNPHCYRFRNLYPDNALVHMEQVGEALYECVVYKGFELAANIFDDLPEGQPYRTNDLFVEDPLGSGYYVLQGRKDDILVHSNGENTSAGPLQLDIQTSSKMIHKALALGHAKPCVSLLVEVSEMYDPADHTIREEIVNTVKEVNKKFPSHSQIMPSMIYFLPQGSSLPVTPKGNVKRKEAGNMYESEIAALYERLEGSMPDLSSSVMEGDLTEYVRSLFRSLSNVSPEMVKDWTPLHELGIDSRLALCLRSSLSHTLGRKISLNTIFENPTVSKLVAALNVESRKQDEQTKIPQSEIINQMISRFETEFLDWPSQQLGPHTTADKEVVLLTGASGSLGTALIQSLSSNREVTHIYALIRGPNQTSRLRFALQSRGIDTSILDSQGKITTLNFAMQDPLLGLDIESYYKLATSVTVVMHNAWKMNFNQTVEDFEKDCIRSTMNLLRFCCTGIRKRFVFTSSISACMGRGAPLNISESPIGPNPEVALSTGYAQSKYVVERLTQSASSKLNIPVTILRVGQLCGSTATGQWNSDEMWPILFASSVHTTINALPALKMKIVDWVPVNVAAKVISEVVFQPHKKDQAHRNTYDVHNITNPNPLPWSTLLDILNKANLSSKNQPLPIIPLSEWLRRHHTTATDLEIPALRLLPSFEGLLVDEEDGIKDKVFETSKTQIISPILKESGPVCEDWAEKWIGRWREEGFLSNSTQG